MAFDPTSLISAGTSLVSSGANILGTKKQQKRAYNYGEMAADNAYQRQLDYWNKTLSDSQAWQRQWFEDYESESARVQRLKEAGLSVGLLSSGGYGGVGGAQLGAQSGSAPQGSGSYSLPRDVVDPSGLDVLARSLQFRKLESEIDLNEAGADKNRAEAGLAPTRQEYLESQSAANIALEGNLKARTIGEQLSNRLQEETFPLNLEMAEQQAQLNQYELDLYVDSLERSYWNTLYTKESYQDHREILQLDIQQKSVGVALSVASVLALEKGIELNDAIIDQIRTGIETELTYDRAKLGKELDWFNADKVIGHINSTARNVIGAFGISKFAKSNRANRYPEQYSRPGK